MNVVSQSTRLFWTAVNRGLPARIQNRGNATLKKDDYMAAVKYPAMWMYAIYGYLTYCCISHGRKMDTVYQELEINGLPLRDRPRDPDHKLLSSYRKVVNEMFCIISSILHTPRNIASTVICCRHYKIRKKPTGLHQLKSKPRKPRQSQLYDYFLVLDFEATCQKPELSLAFQQEIIEFPVYKVNSRNFETEEVFHSFVKPVVNSEISNYCSRLTGITQTDVEHESQLSTILEKFDQWMEEQIFVPQKSHIFVTSGDWDLKSMLPAECEYKNILFRSYFIPYVNVNKSFAYTLGMWPRCGKGRLPAMLSLLGLERLGEFHQGTSDCENIIRIMTSLADRGCVFMPDR